jgi:hypothetical protein
MYLCNSTECFAIKANWNSRRRRSSIKCHILIDLLKLNFVSRNSILSIHVCRATIQNCKKKYFKISEGIPDFWEKKSEKWHGFSSKTWTFPCSTKIWLEKHFPKILKENGSGGLKPLINAQGDWILTICWPWILVDYRWKCRIFKGPLWSPEATKSDDFFTKTKETTSFQILKEEKWKMCRELILLYWTGNLSESQILWPPIWWSELSKKR